ncbi:MAG TPA: MFS transporter [Solirubrobacteraceae bacterium]|nr:MFS transporter [Solirubrobacteraceae bacterium]
MIARQRALFAVPGFTRLLLAAVLGRLPSGMFSLALLLFVRARTGSFLTAGLAVGAFTLAGAIAGPALGALVDRVGQTRVLLASAGAQAAALVALALLGGAHAGAPALLALAALAGACQPPIAGCVRALWPHVVGDGEALQSAYALDATSQEVIWTLGPLLVAGAAGLASPTWALLACAAITLAGTLFFAGSRISSGWRADASARASASALCSRGLLALLGTVAFAGVVIGAVEVGLTAFAAEHGSRWSAGPLLALFSLGSMAGGLAYAARGWRLAPGARYRALLAAMALAVVPLILVRSLPGAFALSLLAGLALAPMLTAQFALVGALAPAGTTTEAFTWQRAATIGGMAAGSALGGSAIAAHGTHGAFALGCAGVALACALATLWRRRIDPDAYSGGRASSASVNAGSWPNVRRRRARSAP